MTHTDRIVRHCLDTRFEDLPPGAVEKAKTFILDSLGVGIAGANAPLTAAVRNTLLQWSRGRHATVWGDGSFRTSAPDAAFINGFQIHCQEFDCVHEPAVVHPMAVLLSSLMAETERSTSHISGDDFITALAIATDLATGLGVAVTSPIRFFRPANAGLFGATAGLARLRGYTAEQTKSAMGHALSFCSGTMQAHIEGMPSLALQVANAARAAHMAVDFVEAGIPGAQDSLEGPYGYLNLFEETADLSGVAGSLGKVWRIEEVSHKPFPTGRAAHGGIVLIQKLRERGVTAENLRSLRLSAPPLIKRLVGRPLTDDMAVSYARLCFQYVGAVALTHGTVSLHDFSDEARSSASLHTLGQRITVLDDGTQDPAAFAPQIATAELENGETISETIDDLYGAPVNPMSTEDHLRKFRACVEFGFGQPTADIADRLIDLTDRLETLPDTSLLARLAAGKELTS